MKRWMPLALAVGLLVVGSFGLSATLSVSHVLNALLDRVLTRVLHRIDNPPAEAPRALADPPGFLNPYWNQAVWAVDPSNTTGCASDANNCSQTTCGGAGSNQGPCLTSNQILFRWATDAPFITVPSVRILFLSAMLSPAQVFAFHPRLGPLPVDGGPISTGPNVSIECTLPAATATGTFTLVHAKTRASNQSLQMTFGSVQTVGEMVVNTTRSNSFGWVDQKIGGGTAYNVSQPTAAVTLPPSGGALVILGENDTWTTGDTWQSFTPINVWIGDVRPTQLGLSETGLVQVINCTIPEYTPGGVQAGDDPFIMGPHVQLLATSVQRQLVVAESFPMASQSQGVTNCSLDGGFNGGMRSQSTTQNSETFNVWAGRIWPTKVAGTGYVSFGGVWLDNDIMVHSGSGVGLSSTSSIVFNGPNIVGTMFLGGFGRVDGGILNATVSASAANVIYGLGTLDVENGTVLYTAATGAATVLPVNLLEINGGVIACCNTVANPSVENCNISLTAAILAAGACSAATPALGNRAFLPGTGAFLGL